MKYQVRYFKPEEFVCNCGCRGGYGRMSSGLIVLLDLARASMGAIFNITSGFRCAAWNARVGGAGNSRHLSGWAADIALPSNLTFSRFSEGLAPFFRRDGYEFKRYPDRMFIHVAVPRESAGRLWDGGDILI